MELSFREKTIKYFIYALVILAASILQNVDGAWFTVFGARCFFLVPVCVIIGLGEDERGAAFLGMFGGALWDMISSQHRIFGLIFLALACYISSSLVNFIFRNTFGFAMIASGVSIVLFILLYWLFFVVPGGEDGRLAALGFFYIPSAVYTFAMTVLIYPALRLLKEKLNKSKIVID